VGGLSSEFEIDIAFSQSNKNTSVISKIIAQGNLIGPVVLVK